MAELGSVKSGSGFRGFLQRVRESPAFIWFFLLILSLVIHVAMERVLSGEIPFARPRKAGPPLATASVRPVPSPSLRLPLSIRVALIRYAPVGFPQQKTCRFPRQHADLQVVTLFHAPPVPGGWNRDGIVVLLRMFVQKTDRRPPSAEGSGIGDRRAHRRPVEGPSNLQL